MKIRYYKHAGLQRVQVTEASAAWLREAIGTDPAQLRPEHEISWTDSSELWVLDEIEQSQEGLLQSPSVYSFKARALRRRHQEGQGS